MKKAFNFFSVITVFSVLFFMSCNTHDYNTADDTPVTDTSHNMVTEPAPVMNTDSGNNAVIKPNPALKGKKGKISSVMMKSATKGAAMNKDAEGYYSNVEVLPAFPGGQDALDTYINKNIEYPEDATNNGIEAVVTVHFAVDEMGKVSNPQIIGKKVGYGLEEAVLKAVNTMPTWTAGAIKGKNVKTYYTLPVNFKLSD